MRRWISPQLQKNANINIAASAFQNTPSILRVCSLTKHNNTDITATASIITFVTRTVRPSVSFMIQKHSKQKTKKQGKNQIGRFARHTPVSISKRSEKTPPPDISAPREDVANLPKTAKIITLTVAKTRYGSNNE